MLKALLILAWRDDVGAYVLHSYPDGYSNKVDGQDLMNLYNAHRFRSTDKNFQILGSGSFNAASFYSGGYQSNYIGKPNFCVTVLLDEGDNPLEYERVLIKVTNILLAKMDEDDFSLTMFDIFNKLEDKRFDEIKVERGGIDFDTEEPAINKPMATTSSASISDEEKIFADLLESSELESPAAGMQSKVNAFEQGAGGDPFSSGGSAADPFSGGSSRDLFAENPFDAAQKPTLDKSFGDESLGKKMFEVAKSTAADIIGKLDALEAKRPQKPGDPDKDVQFKYLEQLVSFLEEKMRSLSSLVTHLKALEGSQQEKDQLIGKLLLLLKN